MHPHLTWVCRLALAAAASLAVMGAAHAGRACEPHRISVASLQRGLELAQHTAQRLDASGAQVVVLARVGQDLSRHGLRYSHLGYAYREPAGWRVVHKLNRCGTSRAGLHRQGLGEFFLDDLHDFQAGYVVPMPEIQARLLPLLRDNGRIATLHTPAYSMVAYPWAQTYQQSNQWAIETLALAMEPQALTRERAQAWLRFKGFEPTELHLSTFTRLGARATSAHVAFDDHPGALRYTGRIRTVSVDAVFAWLGASGLGGPVQIVR